MKYDKGVLTKFSKDCAWGMSQFLNGIRMAEEISHSNIGNELLNRHDDDLLLEISKKYAKYAKDTCFFDAEVGEVQDFQNIICMIFECCEKHNWFTN